MMYLSRAWITDVSAACRLSRAGFYENHKALWSLFADDPDRERDFLYRLDQIPGRGAEYLVVSARPPAERRGWRVETKEYTPELAPGDRLRFSLRANPVRVVTDADGRKRRVDVVMHAKHELREQGVDKEDWPPQAVIAHQAGCSWLAERSEGLGLEFVEPTLRVQGYQVHQRRPSGSRKAIRFASLDIDGLARIADPAALERTLFKGVGPAKAFGCGLLLVRRA